MTNRHPLHRRVAEQLRQRIAGRLRVGDALPPERDLAQELQVSRPTLRSAIQALARDGLLESAQGRGTFVTAVPPPSRAAAPLLHLVISSPSGVVDDADMFVRTLTTRLAALPAQLAAGVRMLIAGPDQASVAAVVRGEDPGLLRGGVMFAGVAAPDADLLAHLRLHGIPAVLIGETGRDDDPLTCLRGDHARTGAAAAAHLIAHGRRRIVLVDGPWTHHPCRLRRDAFLAAERGAGVELSACEAICWDRRRGRAEVLRLLDRAQPPDALAVAGDPGLRGALDALAERGLEAPRDLAVVGVGIPVPAVIPAPVPLTCWQPDLGILARRSAEALMAGRISGHAPVPATILVPDRLLAGRSCGCVEPVP